MKKIILDLIFLAPYSSIGLLVVSYIFSVFGNRAHGEKKKSLWVPFSGMKEDNQWNFYYVMSAFWLILSLFTLIAYVYIKISFRNI
ncbi:MAG TPA: hypothetical protein VIG45_02890 [Erysipelothrix sp.]